MFSLGLGDSSLVGGLSSSSFYNVGWALYTHNVRNIPQVQIHIHISIYMYVLESAPVQQIAD